jgi:hypothetical protein
MRVKLREELLRRDDCPRCNARRDMAGIKRIVVLIGLTVGIVPVVGSCAQAQGVAFQPEVSPLFSGALVSVTPAVSADRRYVRLSLDTSFTHVNGFTPYSVPAAVSGGGGAGGIAGLNGLLGGGAAGGGGGAGRAGSLNQRQGPLAGPLDFGNGSPPIFRDGRNPAETNWPKIVADAEAAAREDGPADRVASSAAGGRRRIQASTKEIQRQRAAALKEARQQALANRRRIR